MNKGKPKSKKKGNRTVFNQISLDPLPVTKILFLALLKKYPDSSGYDLMKIVPEFLNNEIQIKSGSIYPNLHEMEKLDLIKSKVQSEGRKRRLYRLSELGKQELIIMGNSMRKRMNLLMIPLLRLIDSENKQED